MLPVVCCVRVFVRVYMFVSFRCAFVCDDARFECGVCMLFCVFVCVDVFMCVVFVMYKVMLHGM